MSHASVGLFIDADDPIHAMNCDRHDGTSSVALSVGNNSLHLATGGGKRGALAVLDRLRDAVADLPDDVTPGQETLPDVTAVSNRFPAWRLYTMDELAEGDLIRMDNDLDPQRVVRSRKNEMDPSKRTVVTDAGVYVRPAGDPVLVKR